MLKKSDVTLDGPPRDHHLITIVGFFIFVSTCILERVFFHFEGMCSDHK